MADQIRLRRDTAAGWAADPVLALGEVGIETDTTPPRFKVGDGSSAWSALPWAVTGGDVTVDGDIELGSGGPTITTGTGVPEGAVTANSGSIFLRDDASGGAQLYAKNGDASNTGWFLLAGTSGISNTRIPYWGTVTLSNSGSFTFDGTDFVTPNVNITSGGPSVTTGTAVPSASEPQGSIYIRTGSGLGDHQYVSTNGAGTWAPTGACDTGVRNLAGVSLTNGWAVANSAFRLHRSGNVVTLEIDADPASATTGALYTLPAGFRPSHAAVILAKYGSAADAMRLCSVSTAGVITVTNYGTGAVTYIGGSWITNDAWPTSLPGA